MNFSIIFALIPLGLFFAAAYGLFIAVQFVRKKFGWLPKPEVQVGKIEKPKSPFVLPPAFGPAVLFLLAGYNIGLYDTFISQKVPTVGLAIFYVCVGIGWLVLFSKRKLSLAIWTLVLSSVISGILLVVRANGFVQLFNAAIWAISMFGLFAHLVRTHTHWSFLSLLQTILQIIPAGFLQGLLMISSIFRARDSKRSALYGWIKTAGIAIAVFLFFCRNSLAERSSFQRDGQGVSRTAIWPNAAVCSTLDRGWCNTFSCAAQAV